MFEHIKEVIKKAMENNDFSRIKYNLSPEEKEYIFVSNNENEENELTEILDNNYNNLINLIENVYTEEEASAMVTEIDNFNGLKTLAILLSLPTDNLKMQYLDKIEDDENKLYVINGFENDENKKIASEVLPLNLKLEFSMSLPVSPENDEYREKLIEALSKDNSNENLYEATDIIIKLSKDETKVQYIDRVDDAYVNQVFNSLETKESRRKAFDKLSLLAKHTICSSSNKPELNSEMEEYRVELIEEIINKNENSYYILEVIEKLISDDLKIKYIDYLDDSFVGYICKSITSEEGKIKLFNKFYNDNKETIKYLPEIFSNIKNESEKDHIIEKIEAERGNEYLGDFISALLISSENDKYILYCLNKDDINPMKIFRKLSTDELKLQKLPDLPEDLDEWDYMDIYYSLEKDESRAKFIDILMENKDKSIITSFVQVMHIDSENDKILIKIIDNELKEIEHSNIYLLYAAINNISLPELKFEQILKIPEQEGLGLQCELFTNIPGELLKNKLETMDSPMIQSAIILALLNNQETLPENILQIWKLFDNDEDNKDFLISKRGEVLKTLVKTQNITTNFGILLYLSEHKDISVDKIKELGTLVERFIYSNSNELSNLQASLLPLILNSDNPIESFNKIEETFLKNNLPMMAKIYQCFTYLYPDFTKGNIYDFSKESRLSPELINPVQTRRMEAVNRNADPASTRFQIVYNDLLRIAIRSNNRSLKEYIDNIEKGNILFLGITNRIVKYEQLDDASKQVLNTFSDHLNALYEKTQIHEKVPENLSSVDKIMFFNNVFKPTNRYSLPDRIVRSFAYQAGYDSFEQLKKVTIDTIRTKEEISKKRAKELEEGKIFKFEQGDFVRCIGTIDSFGSSLNNGNVCKEFLGAIIGTSDSDTTPLDIDLTLITSSEKDIYNSIAGTPTGFGFGNIFIVFKKDNPDFNITRDSNGNMINSEYNPDKIEVFGSKTSQGGYENHWAIRTGVGSSDIDYILFKEDKEIDFNKPYLEDGSVNYTSKATSNDLAILKNEIVKNGFYIPVVDFSGKLIFSAKEYEEIKNKMQGLSYYGSKEYHLANHTTNDYVEQIKEMMKEERESVKEQSNKVYEALKKSIGRVDKIANTNEKLEVKNKIDLDITPGTVEVLETGSSARGTNIPYEYDFDYIVRIDAARLRRTEKLVEINQAICDELSVSNVPESNFRDVEATVEGLGKIDLDITYVQKTNKTEYSTEMSAKDRIDTLENINPEMKDEVVANIVLAKMLLKKSGCYKPRRKSEEQGGLGGIGIENWITQNGGTLESAARSFLEASEGRNFDEFKTVYHVHDYGKNHVSEIRGSYPYNDFVFDNMNSKGYEKMKNALGKYLNYVEGKTTQLPEIDEYLSAIRDKSKTSTTSIATQELNTMFKTEIPKMESVESTK